MSLYRVDGAKAIELPRYGTLADMELQRLILTNMECLLGVRLIGAGHRPPGVDHGEIDAYGLDRDGCPVVVQFRGCGDQDVIAQGLAWLDWLLDHWAYLQALAVEELGSEAADTINWSGSRLLCVAEAFTAGEEEMARTAERRVGLVRCQVFGRMEFLSLKHWETPDGTRVRDDGGTSSVERGRRAKPSARIIRTVTQKLDLSPPSLVELYEALARFALSLGDDVTVKPMKHYMAFGAGRNFLTVQILVESHTLLACVRVDPGTVRLETGFSRDVRHRGHLGTGDLELRIRDHHDLAKAEDLIRTAYESC